MLFVVIILSIVSANHYRVDIHNAYEALNSYKIESVETNFGKLSYIDIGTGEPVLISHGIFGGYDQVYITLNNVLGEDYRKIAPPVLDIQALIYH